MMVAMATFTMNDAIGKLILKSMDAGQLMFIRGVFATSMILLLLAWNSRGLLGSRHLWQPAVFLRGFLEMMATLCFLAALAHMPLANISAILQTVPLAITMAAALFLGERVGWRRWLAISVGFCGVLIIVQPGFEGFNMFSLLALASVIFAAARDLVTRRIPASIPTLFVSAVSSALVTLMGGGVVLATDSWVPVSALSLGLLAGAAALLITGYQFIIMAMREGDISFAASFRYTSLLWALLLGYLAFGEVPGPAMIIGAAIVGLSGIYVFHRERVAGKTAPVTESIAP